MTLPDQERVRGRARARGSVHGRLRPGHDRHGALRRRRPAGDDVPRAHGALARLRRLRRCREPTRSCGRPARRGRTTRSSPSSAGAPAWRGRAIPSRPRRSRRRSCAPSRRGDVLAKDLARDGDRLPRGGRRAGPVRGRRFRARRTGRSDLVPEELDREAPQGLYAYQRRGPRRRGIPLALISPATDRTISSTLGELHRRGRSPSRSIPPTPRARGVAGRATGSASSTRSGSVRCRARVDAGMRAGRRLPAEGPLEPQHRQRHDGQRAVARTL